MQGRRSGRAFRVREEEDENIAEAVARDFETLLHLFALHEARNGADGELSLTRARDAAHRGLALCGHYIRQSEGP
jgi:hypothetical protein